MTNDVLLSKISLYGKIISFYVDDTTDTYCFDFYENGKYLRKKWISVSDKGIDSSDNFGGLLVEEKDENDHFEIIIKIISSVIGIRFYEIAENKPMFRYKLLSKARFRKRLFG